MESLVSKLVPVVQAESKKSEEGPVKPRLVRPSQLTIYEEPRDLYDIEYHGSEPGKLEEGIRAMRKEMAGLVELTHETREQVEHIYETGKAHTASTVDYILAEDNVAGKVGVIASGGLIGLLLGSRRKGGFFKKLFYTSLGAGGGSAICYPNQAYQLSQEVYNNADTYAKVAYNFLAGVKPQKAPNDANINEKSSNMSKSSSPSSTDENTPSHSKQKEGKSVNNKDVVIAAKPTSPMQVVGDHGQSNPSDADMYTTRG